MGVFVSGFQIYLLTDNYEAFESHLSPGFGEEFLLRGGRALFAYVM